jgi:hypothetical protein
MSRKINVIATEIRQDWGDKVSPHAEPYLNAMGSLESIDDRYYEDSAQSVIAYFLANARGWRGEGAKRIKAELKTLSS